MRFLSSWLPLRCAHGVFLPQPLAAGSHRKVGASLAGGWWWHRDRNGIDVPRADALRPAGDSLRAAGEKMAKPFFIFTAVLSFKAKSP